MDVIVAVYGISAVSLLVIYFLVNGKDEQGLLNPVATPQEIRPTPEIEYGNPRPNI